jgi:hypothetical protein
MFTLQRPCVSVALPLFAGWFVCAALLATPEPLAENAILLRRMPETLARERPLDLDLMIARELRCLPGIGPARALAITRAKWQLGLRAAPASWDRVFGVGVETVAGLRRWIDREKARAPSSVTRSERGAPE